MTLCVISAEETESSAGFLGAMPGGGNGGLQESWGVVGGSDGTSVVT